MLKWTPIVVMLASAGVITTIVAADVREDDRPYFDPVLKPDSQCKPAGATSQSLVQRYQVAANKAETKPFRVTGGVNPEVTESMPPLWEGLGAQSWAITVAHPLAQKYFDQGLRLAYGFNHGEALRAFRAGQKLDVGCAMCFWGEALVLGPNINVPMDAAAVPVAYAAVQRAREVGLFATPRERELIAALSQRYSAHPDAERTKLDQAYAEAMEKVAARYPDDLEIALLHAEALMNLQPWDYWEAGGARPKGRAGEILAQVEKVLAGNPDHPGAIHFYIHLTEASATPERAVPHAERLAALAPNAGHLVHMPSHTYYRVGRYLDSLATNRAAVEADERYFQQSATPGVYRDGLYPHNIHFLMVSAQMAGDGPTAIAAAEKLARTVSEEAASTIPWVQPIKAAPFFTHAQFSRPARILALADPGDALPYVKASWHYARGIAFATQHETASARAEAAAIARIERETDFSALAAGGIPGADVAAVARLVLEARIAQAEGRPREAIAQFERAVDIEDRLAYMEPPFWYYPLRQSLGAAYLMAGDLDRAEQAFRTSLARTPNNGWALFGLREVYRKRGDRAAERAVKDVLDRAWVGHDRLLDLRRI